MADKYRQNSYLIVSLMHSININCASDCVGTAHTGFLQHLLGCVCYRRVFANECSHPMKKAIVVSFVTRKNRP